MSGKPAARQGDMTRKGADIVQGSAGVLIGAPTGVACSVCPGGKTSGNPVNPLLGAKVFPGETDIALPGPLPFVLTRSYSSYRTTTPAPVGISGPGWKTPSDIYLQIRDEELVLNDNGGRSIHFEPLLPGETAYSRSESFWLARGGVLKLHESNPLHTLWQTLPEAIRTSQHMYLATNSVQGPWWMLGWPERVPDEDEALPAPLPPYRVLTGLTDRFGHTLTYHRDAAGDFTGQVTAVTDGAGRRFRLVLTTQAQRAEQSRRQAAAEGKKASPFPDALSASGFGADGGIRLAEVWLTHDPEYPDELPAAPLARYGYTPRGELAAVYDRSGTQVRAFEYDPQYPGRMTAHRYTGRPQTRYRYDASGRVVEQRNPEGLSYTYVYENNRVTVTDSLNRREVLHTEGEGGLKRVVREERPDGSMLHSEFDNAGRLTAQTDAAGRRTEYRLNVASGSVDAIVLPDGRTTQYYYNSQRQLTDIIYPDGLESSLQYDDRGRLVQEQSRSGGVTRYFYDDPQSEHPSATKDATGSKRHMTWSRYGQLLTFTDCSGYQTRYEYDRFGQMTAVHREEGLSVYRKYDNRGRLISQQDGQGHETRYEYNAAGDLTAVTDPAGNRSETRYDARGNAVSTTTGGLTRQMAYDAAGRVTQLTNENGSHSEFTWDVLDRLTQQTGFDGRTQRYDYDLTGKLTQSEDAGLVTRWYYDESDRLTHRTVNGEPAEQWRYDEQGRLAEISHLSEGHRVAVHYRYDRKGRPVSERQTVHNPETDELLWQHETKQGYSDQGLANRFKPDNLPPVEWLTYGSGYLAGMKLGDIPLLEFTRDRLHRETLRHFGTGAQTGAYELTTAYTAGGQLQSQHPTLPQFNRDYGYDDAGRLARISEARQTREYGYSGSGRLTAVILTNGTARMEIPYETDAAGNRLEDKTYREASGLAESSPDNRIAEDSRYVYRYDASGSLTEKYSRVPVGAIRSGNEKTHHYRYDSQHRLVHYRLTHGFSSECITESRYVYDPAGRRVCRRVWQCRRLATDRLYEVYGDMPRRPEVTWYGWDGDRLVTTQTQTTRIQTVYQPGSFTPLIRIETATEALAKTRRRSLAEKLCQETGVVFPAELVAQLDRLEAGLKRGEISEQNRQWLAQCGLSQELLAGLVEPEYTPQRKIHLYHCDHRGLPLALVNTDGTVAWSAEYDEWGNQLAEHNPDNLLQLIRLPGQQFDKETWLYYNRHRYYDPLQQRRYITQDPIGLKGGMNPYTYPLNPVVDTDPLGLVNLNLYPMRMHSDRILHLASDLIDIPGVYTVGGHGDRWGKTINNPDSPYRPYSVDDLAKIIKNDKNYKPGMPVKLFSCELAYGGNGSFASQLAKKLHAKVIAADTNWDVWVSQNHNEKSGILDIIPGTIRTAPAYPISQGMAESGNIPDGYLGNWVTFNSSGEVISSVKGKIEEPGDIK